MTTPIEKLFQIYTKKLAITKEQAEDATREYKTRVSQLPPKERKTFDYLVTFLDDVTKANHTNIFDVARSQYEKLQRSAPDYRSDVISFMLNIPPPLKFLLIDKSINPLPHNAAF